jgi:hypothetical protein
LTNNAERNIYAYLTAAQQRALSSEPWARHDLVSYPTLQRSITFLTRAIHKTCSEKNYASFKTLGEDKEMASLHNSAMSD